MDSLERCLPQARLCIVDDHSDDEETRRVLADLETRHQVLRPVPGPRAKHGGLYHNLQQTLEHFAEAPLLCCLQDDMQAVRPLGAEEPDQWRHYFDRHPRAAFLQPCFLKGSERARERQALRFDAATGHYERGETGRSVGSWYSDIFVCQPGRLLAAGWRFGASEAANERQARQLFQPLAQLHAPFLMWLPEAPAWRGRRKTFALRLAERRRGSGFHPYRFMGAEEAGQLRRRDPAILPFAEDFLDCASPALPKPWHYYPLQGSRWLKKLNSAELLLRRLAGVFNQDTRR